AAAGATDPPAPGARTSPRLLGARHTRAGAHAGPAHRGLWKNVRNARPVGLRRPGLWRTVTNARPEWQERASGGSGGGAGEEGGEVLLDGAGDALGGALPGGVGAV